MSIATEIDRLTNDKAAIKAAIEAKGGSVSGTLDNYAAAIAALPSGSGIEVLEGDITITTEANNILITTNLGKIPFFATIELTSSFTPASSRIWKAIYADSMPGYTPFGNTVGQSSGVNCNNDIQPSTTESAYSAWFRTDEVRCYSGNSLRLFLTGTYHYKIYYTT